MVDQGESIKKMFVQANGQKDQSKENLHIVSIDQQD
jgi:hypothetical protein